MSDEAGFQAAVQEEVCKRQQQAIEDIANKYALGKGGIEESVNAPTGKAYAELHAKVAEKRAAALKQSRIEAEMEHGKENNDRGNFEGDEDGGDDDDADLRALREQRMKALRSEQRELLIKLVRVMDNIGKSCKMTSFKKSQAQTRSSYIFTTAILNGAKSWICI